MRVLVEQVDISRTSPGILTTTLSLSPSNLTTPSSQIIVDKSDKMWSSAGLGPPTYRPFEFAYDDYRSGMSDFGGGLAGAPSAWTSAGTTTPPATAQTPVTAAAEPERVSDDSVRNNY